MNGEFYSEGWANTGYGAYVTGNSAHFHPSARVWTGCDAFGGPHPTLPMGANTTMHLVAVGTPNDTESDNNAPLGAVDVESGFVAHNYYVVIDGEGQERLLPLYAISPVFTVGAGPGGWLAMKSIGRINSTGSAHRALALQGPSAGALGPHGIRLALLAALVLAGMALWPTPAPADGEEAGDLVWSADMTALEYASVSTGAAGADLFSNMGGSGNLQVKSLWSHWTAERGGRSRWKPDRPRTEPNREAEGGVHMAFDRPVHAPETADGTTAPAVALPVAPGGRRALWPGTAVHPPLRGVGISFATPSGKREFIR